MPVHSTFQDSVQFKNPLTKEEASTEASSSSGPRITGIASGVLGKASLQEDLEAGLTTREVKPKVKSPKKKEENTNPKT
jgi:hypothetical protein